MRLHKNLTISISALLLVYSVSYLALSVLGGYKLTWSGQWRPNGVALLDTFIWQPRFGMCYPYHTAMGEDTYRLDALGAIYFPLIRLDQLYVHRSRPFLSFGADRTVQAMHPSPPSDEWHPSVRGKMRAEEAKRERYEAEKKDLSLINTGDVLELSVEEIPAFDAIYVVGLHGSIILPRLGRVQVGGLNTDEAEKAIGIAICQYQKRQSVSARLIKIGTGTATNPSTGGPAQGYP